MEGRMSAFGIPYGRTCELEEHLAHGCIICPVCHEHIMFSERKDFESFSSRKYAVHWESSHGQKEPRNSSSF